MFLLDTNICIFAIKRKSTNLLQKIYGNLETGILISSLTVAELEFGVSNSQNLEKNRMALLEFLSIFRILDFKETDAIPYGIIKTDLRRKGTTIGPIDILLSAQAVSNDLIFVTNNTKEFSRIENLKIEDWSR